MESLTLCATVIVAGAALWIVRNEWSRRNLGRPLRRSRISLAFLFAITAVLFQVPGNSVTVPVLQALGAVMAMACVYYWGRGTSDDSSHFGAEWTEASEDHYRALGDAVHHSLAQTLTATSFTVALAGAEANGEAATEMAKAEKLVRQAIQQAAGISRTCLGTRDAHWVNCLRLWTETTSELFGIRCEFRCPSELLEQVENGPEKDESERVLGAQALRLAQQLVFAAREAGARSAVVGLSKVDRAIEMRVEYSAADDTGFVTNQQLHSSQFRATMLASGLTIERGANSKVALRCLIRANEKSFSGSVGGSLRHEPQPTGG